MSNQNRTTIDKLKTEIDNLKLSLESQKELVLQKEAQIEELNRAHQNKLTEKEEKINGLQRKIDDMSNEFAEMLKVLAGLIAGNSRKNAAAHRGFSMGLLS